MNGLQLLASVGMPATPTDHAGAAKVLNVRRSTTIDAPVSAVWAKCGSFDALDAWLSLAARTTLTGGRNNVPGAVRHIDVKGGGTVDEELLAYRTGDHAFEYRILSGVLPVSDYRSEFSAKDAGHGTTVVTWASTFRRRDPGEHPAADTNDETALAAITGLYETGLADLKRVVEGT